MVPDISQVLLVIDPFEAAITASASITTLATFVPESEVLTAAVFLEAQHALPAVVTHGVCRKDKLDASQAGDDAKRTGSCLLGGGVVTACRSRGYLHLMKRHVRSLVLANSLTLDTACQRPPLLPELCAGVGSAAW